MLELPASNELPNSPPVLGLHKVRDLLFLDGPLLSHYASDDGEQYLYHWCETDGISHRWMLLRADGALIDRMRYRFVSMDSVIPKGCRDDFVHIVDLGANGIEAVRVVPLTGIPKSYLPEPGVLLHEDPQDDDSELVPQHVINLPPSATLS